MRPARWSCTDRVGKIEASGFPFGETRKKNRSSFRCPAEVNVNGYKSATSLVFGVGTFGEVDESVKDHALLSKYPVSGDVAYCVGCTLDARRRAPACLDRPARYRGA